MMEKILTHTVTNRKLTEQLGWADFRGFSLLFDNPGNSLMPAAGNLQKIHCPFSTDESLQLYKSLDEALEALNPFFLKGEYLFCALPTPSFHVTAWDGLNDLNKSGLTPGKHICFQTFLDRLPDDLAIENEWIRPAFHSSLCKETHRLTFVFDGIRLWKNQTLVAVLKPADAASKIAFAAIASRRSLLNAHYQALGPEMREAFVPHVSLGYFANESEAKRALPLLAQWQTVFRECASGKMITFDSISGYGFTDMATFFKSIPQK